MRNSAASIAVSVGCPEAAEWLLEACDLDVIMVRPDDVRAVAHLLSSEPFQVVVRSAAEVLLWSMSGLDSELTERLGSLSVT